MRTRSRSRLGWSAAGALAFVLGLPMLADAQTTELFPFARLNRKRVPCEMEDPVYKLYRQQYYGYHPTCWRRFPTGWGCPSPEAPDAAKAFKELKRDTITPPDDGNAPGPDNGDAPRGRGTAPGMNPNTLPLPTGDRSPFEMDTKPDPTPNGATPPASRPSASAPPASNNDGGAGLPPIAEPAVEGPSASNTPTAAPVHIEPILTVADPTVAPSSAAMAPDVVPPPAQAPRRTSIITNLFGNRSSFFRR
jgi:hypothetical protein